MGRLDGKVALIGGSLGKIKKGKFSENLGGVIAKDMQDEGAQVVLVDIDDEVAKSCAEHLGGNAVAMECDLMKEREFETVENDQGKTDIVWKDNPALDVVNKIAEDYGKLDILVTAFDEFPRMRKMTKMKEGRYEKMRDGNIFPVFHLLAAVREQFKAQNAQDGSYAKVV